MQPADVNSDGYVTALDALLLVQELRNGGSRTLSSAGSSSGASVSALSAASSSKTTFSAASFTAASATESATDAQNQPVSMLLDVNGDGYFTAADALAVVHELTADPLVKFRFDVVNAAGKSVTTAAAGDSLTLNIYVQDLRDASVVDRGLFDAYIDVLFDSPQVSLQGSTFTYGDKFNSLSDQLNLSAGFIDNLGVIAKDPLNPMGGGEFLMASVPFTAGSPLSATADNADNNAALSITEDAAGVTIDALANDISTANAVFSGAYTGGVPLTDSYLFNRNTLPLAADEMEFVNDSVQINAAGALKITGVSTTSLGGTAAIVNGGTKIQYTPPAGLNSLQAGQQVFDNFTYTLSDGVNTSTATITVTINGLNDAPNAAPDALATNANATVGFTAAQLLQNDTDPESDPVNFVALDTTGLQGKIVDNGGGNFSYDPNGKFNGLKRGQTATDVFHYTINDGNGGVSVGTVTVTITGINHAPTANAVTGLSTNEDTALNGSVATAASDLDGDALSFALVGGTTTPQGAAISVNANGSFTYNPATSTTLNKLAVGASATDSFTYSVSDGQGGTASNTVTITVTGVNDKPIAVDDSGLIVDEGSSGNVLLVLANDSDPDTGDTISINSVDATGSKGGTLAKSADGLSVLYTPAAGFTGTETFHYTIKDNHGGVSAPATVTIDVQILTLPRAGNDTFAVSEDSTANVLNVFANDRISVGGTATLEIAAQPTKGGSVAVDGTTIKYTPAHDFFGVETFTYRLLDGVGTPSEATVSVTVNNVNDAPDAVDAAFTTNEDSLLSDTLAGKATDVDGDALTFSGATLSAQGATVKINANGTFSYDPRSVAKIQQLKAGQSLVDTFSFTARDPSGLSDSATVSVTVNGLNDAPTAVADSGAGFATAADQSFTTDSVLKNDSDVEGDALAVSALDTTGAKGLVTNNGDGTFTYNPNGKFNDLPLGQTASDTFRYTVSDGNGGTATATVTIQITGYNHNPTATNDTYRFVSGTGAQLLDVLANDKKSQDAGETLTIASTTTPSAGGTVTIEQGKLRYTPKAGYLGQETFQYTIGDGQGGTSTAQVTVNLVTYTPSSFAGSVFIDGDGDGLHDTGEHGISGINVTLQGTSIFGDNVSLSAKTDGTGHYAFTNLAPGKYTVSETQPGYIVDGSEHLGTPGATSTVNDKMTLTIPEVGGVVGAANNFAETGLQANLISVWDFLNSSVRKGILFAVDAQTGQLWSSLLEGWDGFASATGSISADRSTLNVTMTDQAGGSSTFQVALRESKQLHVRGQFGSQYVLQVLGGASDFGQSANQNTSLSAARMTTSVASATPAVSTTSAATSLTAALSAGSTSLSTASTSSAAASTSAQASPAPSSSAAVAPTTSAASAASTSATTTATAGGSSSVAPTAAAVDAAFGGVLSSNQALAVDLALESLSRDSANSRTTILS